MRGKVTASCNGSSSSRITPAYAGKRVDFTIAHNTVWDHPRLCGEKPATLLLDVCTVGSPPPMRGKADVVLNRIDRIGITPAYAGKSAILSCVQRSK